MTFNKEQYWARRKEGLRGQLVDPPMTRIVTEGRNRPKRVSKKQRRKANESRTIQTSPKSVS